jgi:hypothetical protein
MIKNKKAKDNAFYDVHAVSTTHCPKKKAASFGSKGR